MTRFGVVLEIALTADGGLPERLLVAAYRASTFEPIALVLTGVEVDLVDRCLDQEVSRKARVSGVRYFTWKDPIAVARIVSEAFVRIGSSPAFLALSRIRSTPRHHAFWS